MNFDYKFWGAVSLLLDQTIHQLLWHHACGLGLEELPSLQFVGTPSPGSHLRIDGVCAGCQLLLNMVGCVETSQIRETPESKCSTCT